MLLAGVGAFALLCCFGGLRVPVSFWACAAACSLPARLWLSVSVLWLLFLVVVAALHAPPSLGLSPRLVLSLLVCLAVESGGTLGFNVTRIISF